jgi:hypothetical protein
MDEMLSHYPLAWQRVASFDSASGALSSWMVYKFVPGKMSAVNLPTVLESRQH